MIGLTFVFICFLLLAGFVGYHLIDSIVNINTRSGLGYIWCGFVFILYTFFFDLVGYWTLTTFREKRKVLKFKLRTPWQIKRANTDWNRWLKTNRDERDKAIAKRKVNKG